MSEPTVVAPGQRQHIVSMSQLVRAGDPAVQLVASTKEALAVLQESRSTFALLDLGDCSASMLQTIPPELGARIVLMTDLVRRDWWTVVSGGCAFGALIAGPEAIHAPSLLLALRKLLRGDIFGIEKYLAEATPIIDRELHISTERTDGLDDLTHALGERGLDPRFIARAVTIADEFITNAFYDAPTDESGEACYKYLPREEPLRAPASGPVRMSWGCDGRRLAIGVQDRVGSFGRSSLLRALTKAIAYDSAEIDLEREGGAGIGLFTVARAANEVIFNIKPGHRTECIGLINVHGPYREVVPTQRNIQAFYTGEP
jgi:hypothetical protein